MARVLITGVAGLLGAHLSRHLLADGHDVVGIDSLFGGYIENIHPRVDFHEIDLENGKDVNQVFEETKPHYVYHFAAYAAVGLSPYIRNFNYRNNVLSSANIVNACVNYNIKKVIFTSSMDVYGDNTAPFTEDQKPSPTDPYGIAKYTVEQDLKSAKHYFDLDYSIIRPHNVVGIYQNLWDRYRNVIGIWIRKILNDEPITIFGDGTQRRAFSDVYYYMNPFAQLMHNHAGETFNIGADQDISILEAAQALQKVARDKGYNPDIVHLEPRVEVHTMYCNHDKAKAMLDFKDGTDLEKLMGDMLGWATTQPNREVKRMEYEIEKNMYSFWK